MSSGQYGICSSSGEVRLLNSCFTRLSAKTYYNRSQRNDIIKYWHKLYGKSFQKMIIEISPNIDENRDEKMMKKVAYHARKNSKHSKFKWFKKVQ